MVIAKIVGSNSHIDYVARVVDELDAAEAPALGDHRFGQFVGLDVEGATVVGVIYNSLLINPEYANFGPRLSPRPALEEFTPDYISEQGILLGIMLLGTLNGGPQAEHDVPATVVPAGTNVLKLSGDAVRQFHTDENGGLRLHYFSQVMSHAGPFALPLLRSIAKAVGDGLREVDRDRLDVLTASLTWQSTFGQTRL